MSPPPLTNFQLEDILKCDPILNFCGVKAYDQIPNYVLSYPCGFVFNTDTSGNPGKHWVSVYFDENKGCQYFCPLGIEPYGVLYDFVRNNSSTCYFNKTTLQYPLSTMCGYYVVYHLLHAARGKDLTYVVDTFGPQLKLNDERVFHFVHSWVERCHGTTR